MRDCAERQYEVAGNTVGCKVALKDLLTSEAGIVY